MPTNSVVARLNKDERLRHQYFTHWLECELPTKECFACQTYTQTDYFNYNYRETEAHMTMAPRRPSILEYEATTRPTQKPRPGLAFRKATSHCPYGASDVTFIVLKDDDLAWPATSVLIGDKARFCKTASDKIAALLDFEPSRDLILVAWPGQTQDIFAIRTKEERDKALATLGLKPRTTPAQTFTASDGTVFEEA